MKELPTLKVPLRKKSPGVSDIVAKWDDRNSLSRLQLIMDNFELFKVMQLITQNEIEWLMKISESEREYIVNREDNPIFTRLNLKATLATQLHRRKLKVALEAVFL